MTCVLAHIAECTPVRISWLPVVYGELPFVANIHRFVQHTRDPKYNRMRPH